MNKIRLYFFPKSGAAPVFPEQLAAMYLYTCLQKVFDPQPSIMTSIGIMQ